MSYPFAMLDGKGHRSLVDTFETHEGERGRSISLSTHTGSMLYITTHDYGGKSLVIDLKQAEWLRDQLLDLLPRASIPTGLK